MIDVALLFPPLWYYAAVPADLAYTAGHLQALGLRVHAWNGSAAFTAATYPDTVRTLATPGVLGSPAHHQAVKAWYARAHELSLQYGAKIGPRKLTWPDLDDADVVRAEQRGLDPFRNPALPLLDQAVAQTVAQQPSVVAIAMVHPDQRVQAIALSSLLRRAGFQGTLVWYGSFEDFVGPSDFAPSLLGTHRLHRWVDGVFVGDAAEGLAALARGEAKVPNLLRKGDEALPDRHEDPLVHPPVFGFVVPEHHPFPTPIVDLRLGRGCPWGRCRFCGIQAHHPRYRAGPIEAVVEGMRRAHATLGSSWFRIRDDLLTPVQLRRLGRATHELPFEVHWSARARFTQGLTRSALEEARRGGLEELSLGLESAVPRVRALMDKGVEQSIVERVLREGADLGIRLRALCMLGYPGETVDEAEQTVRFLEEHAHLLAAASVSPYEPMRMAPLGGEVPPDPQRRRIDVVLAHPPDSQVDAIVTALEPRILALASKLGLGESGPDPAHRWLAAKARG